MLYKDKDTRSGPAPCQKQIRTCLFWLEWKFRAKWQMHWRDREGQIWNTDLLQKIIFNNSVYIHKWIFIKSSILFLLQIWSITTKWRITFSKNKHIKTCSTNRKRNKIAMLQIKNGSSRKWLSERFLCGRRKGTCPGFGQDRVNFHRNPGKGHSRVGWPHLAKQSTVFHTMCRHAGFRWGRAERRELTHGSGVHSAGPVWESGSLGRALFCFLRRCCVFSLSVLLLFLFPLFAVLLNCPYPDPPVSACFFPFSSAPWQGEGLPRGAFVAGRSQTITPNKNNVADTTLHERVHICKGTRTSFKQARSAVKCCQVQSWEAEQIIY